MLERSVPGFSNHLVYIHRIESNLLPYNGIQLSSTNHFVTLRHQPIKAYIKHLGYQFYTVVKYCKLQIAYSQNHVVFVGHMNKMTAHLSQN